MRPGFAFHITHRDGAARRGRLVTPSGVVETPAFMPVATHGVVRGVAASDLKMLGAQILLANTYHLHLRPGEDVVAESGGLAGFTGWRAPWLTDSGGFQVTSLAARARVDEDGVIFASPLDGSRRRLTPEDAVRIQETLASDIAMVLDECRPMAEKHRSSDSGGSDSERQAVARTRRWAERCRKTHKRPEQALFGIVQGGASPALRRESARATADLDFDGYAHGGLGLGETHEERLALVVAANEELPNASPRYLMGLGRPEDVVAAAAAGIELFDCVVPTRNARHGLLFTSEGVLAIRNARFKRDSRPPDPDCVCTTCTSTSRAYLRHLFQIGDLLSARLASLHNLMFYMKFMGALRAAIEMGCFSAFRKDSLERFRRGTPDT